jgi:hypothetical protein
MKNQVIKVLNKKHVKKVIEYWESKGVNTMGMSGSSTKKDGQEGNYYGVINNMFNCYSINFVRKHNAEIIELPIENSRPFPKLMLVSMFPFGNSAYNTQTRVVVSAGNGYAVGVNNCESLDDYIKLQNSNMLSYTLWKYYQEIPNKVIISKAEIAEKFGVPFDYIKIVD